MKLSVCLAVYNEEKNLHYALDSIIDIADEIIIIDGGSEDNTVQLAKSYGKKVKVFITDNPPMFHINKQKAISKARGEWILQLDADEAVSKKLKKEIEFIIETPPSFTVAYYVPRRNFFLTRFLKKGGQYPDYTLRFYKKGVAHFPCQDVHENVKLTNKKDKIDYLKNPLLHYADPSFSRYLLRWDRYTTLEARVLISESKKRNHFLMFFGYFFWKPTTTFFSIYFRHKGFVDGFPGFVFALFSSIRFWLIYIKYWVKKENGNTQKI